MFGRDQLVLERERKLGKLIERGERRLEGADEFLGVEPIVRKISASTWLSRAS